MLLLRGTISEQARSAVERRLSLRGLVKMLLREVFCLRRFKSKRCGSRNVLFGQTDVLEVEENNSC